jgi:tRNA pseudouridine38-40 synthase
MPRYALALEYDGRAFQGTQAQAGQRTLQAVLEAAATAIAGGERTMVRLSSRLDAEVNAALLPGDVDLARDFEPRVLGRAFAANLPADVVARRVAVVDGRWNAKRDAVEKTYLYRVIQRGVRPVLDTRALWVRQLDRADLLPVMAAMIAGRLDLSGFACMRGDDSDHGDPSRHYRHAEWTREIHGDDVLWSFRITGEGFLYKQIRGLVGAMVKVAQGRATHDAFLACLRGGWGARRVANLAPGCGLFLERVRYDPEPDWVVV